MRRALMITAVLLTLGTRAAAQDNCQQSIDQARRAYAEGNFEQVLRLTEACTADRASSEEAYALRARTYVATDRMAEAEQAVLALLRVNPQFSPGSDDLKRFAALVARIRRELARGATSSVSKMDESLMEAPATVVVVTADDIKRRGYLDLEAVLHDLPGFDISRTNGQNYSNIYQRGYRSDATNRTLFIVDGVEQNDLHSNIAHISRQYPLSNIDRIEVVYGPASTMYGANAFLGVINVITKEPEDFIADGKNMGAEVHLGGGAFKSRYVDASVAGRFRDATFSLTGRAYRSDEYDLSRFPAWSYDSSLFSTPYALARYPQVLPGYDYDTNSPFYLFQFVPTEFGIARAARNDAATFGEPVNGLPLHYSDLTDDWMLSGKLKVSGFLIGFEAWRRREGAASSATFRREPGALNGNVWVPSQTSAFVRYNTALSGSLTWSYFGQAKLHRLGRGSASFSLSNYLDGPLNLNDDLVNDVHPFWVKTQLEESSIQFRNEVNLVFRFKDTLSVVSGIDLRNGLLQGDYAKATNCTPPPTSRFKDGAGQNYTQDTLPQLMDRVFPTGERPAANTFGDLYTPFVQRLVALLHDDIRSQPRCSLTGTTSPPITSGGEHYAVRDTGLFAQASYKPIPALKFVGGVRVDNDNVGAAGGFPPSGFGTVATPRLGAVISSGGLVFKAVYSEAFKDPSSLERFSTIPGIRDAQSPGLQPERAKNLEVSGGRQWPAFSVDISMYRTAYSDLITLRNRDVANHSAICTRLSSGSCYKGAAYDALVGRNAWFLAPAGSANEAQAHSQLVEMFGGLSPKVFDYFFNAPLVTAEYTNTGAMTVWGVQASATGHLRGVDVFGNYTYSSPFNVEPTDEFGDPLQGVSRLRVADVATHHLNIGAANRWGKFDGSLRLNYVGARPTGAGTTVGDPLVRIPNSEPRAYTVANATLGFDIRTGITAQVIVNNLFDSHYWDPGVGTADGIRFATSVPQPGRSAFVRLLARF